MSDNLAPIQIGRFAWRGAVGGALGMFALISYICFKAPYNLAAGPYLLLMILIGGGNGMVVGALIGFVGDIAARRFGLIVRIIFGTILTGVMIGAYLESHEGIGEDLRRFLLDSLLLGLLLGGLAGAIAGIKSGDARALP